ncbi:zinc finger protein 40 isoform X1 [Zootoca vivipara]|uniref:zinc finger protein 40 isoform X1 n=1 Tax=Zootoca vivipara TaxID=8524 RepID=UPI001591D1F7|nr:zinc finger protein 40 isoform X1 [Zootoca vivipara]XP_034980369.1 zinc finger protein 40 isoform X1 [Zootoca vivipara]XP_034980370.1 zinc finger protein 40 isoform X1 [Zootoca vivipara]XP_034980371.1 zinc finger protein 40 isoform X1 [Zootoca vivipara]XP_034980372.1 zinc finger protein 40 isoform X1 [Zootoca vivipara]XP_034980374.1 zinc finger protein 40 isoform X1 [Zootoca vivipara]XP_034980375.1 zinc finger protein 40 isoform X1 [Zootoca vivipara]XP_034980376.1 zinc finger protein 40 i
MRMPRTKQINPRNLRDKIEEAQKELNETEDSQKEISKAATRGSTDTVKGVKRKKIVTENHLTKIPKSPLRTPARAKPKEKVEEPSSLSNILPDTSELLKEVHSLATQNGKQNKQNEGVLSSEVAIKTSKPETSVHPKLSLLPQSLDLNKWPVEDHSSSQLNLTVKKGSTSSSAAKADNNECITFVDCSHSSSCTNTAFDVLLKAMEPELNTLAQECPFSGMQIEKLRPNKTASASSCLTSNTLSVQSHVALVQPEFVAGSQFLPCTSQTVHVATSGKSEQAQMPSADHSQEQVLAKAGQQNQQIAPCQSFTNSLVQQPNLENLKVQNIYSIAVTSSIMSPQSSVTQAFSQNQLVAKSPLSVHPSSSTTQLSIAPLYNSAQIASVVSHGVEQICNLLKVQKPKKLGKYVCEYCNRACAKPSVLLKHIRSHTGERPYPCETCGFSFKTKSNLYKHKKSHAHAIKLGLVLQPDSSGFLSHESDKALSIHSDVEESGDSDDEGTADERQEDQGSLEIEPVHVVKIPSNSDSLHKGSPISLRNPEYMLGDSSFQDSSMQPRTALPKVIVCPANVSPLRSDSPKVADPTSTLSKTQQQGDLKVTNVKPNLTRVLVNESDAKQHQKTETSVSEEQLGTPVGTAIHAQLQRQQATDCSQDQQVKCLLSPRSLGSTDSGYFSRSESADQTMSPPAPFMKGLPSSEKDSSKSCVPRMSTTVASVVQTICADKTLLSSGQMRPPLATKTLEERISKLISDNEAVVDDKQLDSVKPRRTSLSRRGSIDSPKSYIFKDSFQFDLKPMSRRTSSSSDIPKSPFTPTEKSKQVFLLSVPTLDCLPITRSNSMPTTSYSAVPTNVIPPPHPLRGSQSFDDKIGSLYDDVFVPGPATPQLQGGHPRTLVRQAAIEDSSVSEGHTFGQTRSVDESYGCSTSSEFLMSRSKSFVQGSTMDKKKSQQGRGTMFECETCRNRYRKLENFENHKKFYCSELHGPKTKAAIRDSEHKTVLNSTQPQILHYRVATSTGVWEQTSQIRKRRKMKSVGDDDDELQTNDTSSSLSKSIAGSECQNKLGNTISVSKHTAAVLGSRSISLQKLAQDELETHGAEQTVGPKLMLHGENQAVPVAPEKKELKRQAGISVIQHTNSLSRPSSFEKSDSFERVSPVSLQDANKSVKLHSLSTIIAQEEKHSLLSPSHRPQVAEASRVQLHERQVTSNEKNAPMQPLRLVRQHNIQVPEILVTEEPDRDQESQCSDQDKTEKFNWPQRSETLSKLPTEKLPPKKKRIRLAEMEHSSAESSFESTLSRSLSRESSLSRASSFSNSFDKDDVSKNEIASKAEPTNKSLEFLTIPTSSNTLGVPGPHFREMRRAASEQINCTQPSMEVADYRSKSFDCGSAVPSKPASLLEISTSKLTSGSGHVPLLERRRGPLVRQISLNIAPEKNQPDVMSSTSFQISPATDISSVSLQRLQGSGKPEELSSSSQNPQTYIKPLRESQSVKSNNSLNPPSSERSLGSSLHHPGQQASLNQYSQSAFKGSSLGTQKSMSMVAGQHSMQEDCFAPKYQLQVKALHIGKQYPLGLPGAAGTEQTGSSFEIHTKLNDKVSKPYVAPPLQRTAPNNCSGGMYHVAPFIPVRIHSNIPSYGLAAVAPLPQILVTRDQVNQSLCKINTASVPTVKDQTQLPKSHKDHLRCLPSSQPASVFENLICETESKNSASLGSSNMIQKVPVGGLFPQQEATASSKRMLSPANSLDIAMEKHQKRVKDESGAACTTGTMSLHPLTVKASEPNKQKKPLLVRQICTVEPLEGFSLDLDDKSTGAGDSSDLLLPGSAESARCGASSLIKEPLEYDNPSISETGRFAVRKSAESTSLNSQTSFLKVPDNSQERMSPEVNDDKQSSVLSQAKSGAALSVVNADDIQRLSFPSLKTTTNFTWCYLLKRKPVHLLQNDQKTSVYSSWSVSPDNPNPLGLPTKLALSLLNSKQKAGKPSYTLAISTNFKSDILVYSSKWKNNLLKRALVKQKAAREFSNKENSEISTDQDNDNSLAKSEPRRVKIFDGGYKSNEEYVYVRGRGRGKYICEECGIRCKKPSMLKKHIRTHTDVRPYHCNYCNFSFKTKGNLTKHMKSKAHSKKCMDLGVSVGLIDDQDVEEYGEKQRLGYDRSGFDAEDSEGPDDDDNDNEDDDEDSQAESVLSATPSVSASPQHHPSRNISQEISSADEEIRIADCFAGVHTDSMDGLPKALLTKMTVLSTVQSDCRSSGPLVTAVPREANEGNVQDRATSTDPAVSSETVPKSPCHQMYVDYPEEALGSSAIAPTVTTVTSKSTTSTRLPSPPVDQSTQTSTVVPSMASPFPEMQLQKPEEHQQQIMKSAPPQTHLFSHLPLHSQQQTKTPYGMIPVGGIHVVPAGLATYSTFLPIQAGPVQLTIPAVSVIHRTTSALGDPACAMSGTANHLSVAEMNSVVPCIPIGQINVPGIQSLSAPTLQPLPSLSMETVNILGLTNTNITPQIHPSGLTLNAVGLQVLTANPSPQSNSSPQTHIPGLQILNIALPTLIPSVSPVTADGQGIPETPASSSKASETRLHQGPASVAGDAAAAPVTSATSPQVGPTDQQYSIESRLEADPSSGYQRHDSPGKLDTEKPDSQSHTKPKCNINSVQVEQASASEPPMKVNSDVLPNCPRHRTVSLDRQAHRRKGLPERQNTVEFSDGSSDDEDRLIIET